MEGWDHSPFYCVTQSKLKTLIKTLLLFFYSILILFSVSESPEDIRLKSYKTILPPSKEISTLWSTFYCKYFMANNNVKRENKKVMIA